MTKVLRYSAALLFVTALSLLVGGSAAAQSTNNPRYRQFRDTAAASITTPAAGNVRLFFDSTGFYWKNSAGVSTALGGSGITGLTEAVVPAVAAGGSSLEDSKMTTSVGGASTGKGVWTLYDNTAVNGLTRLVLRAGAAQPSTSVALSLVNTVGAEVGSFSFNGSESRVISDQLHDNALSFRLVAGTATLQFSDTSTIGWAAGVANGAKDIGLARSAAGIIKVTDGSTGYGTVTAAAFGANTGSSAAASFFFNGDPNTGIYSDSADRLFLSAGGNTAFLSTTLFRSPSIFQIGATDITFTRVASGIVQLSNDVGGQSGFGLSDAATATVSDALILRHATSGTAAASFGTGLLFQGENAAGTMHDMASIDAVYIAATDTAEEVDLKFYTMKAGAEDLAMTIGADFFGTGAKSLEFPGDLYVYAAGGNLFLGGGGVEWEVAGTALRPVTTNYNTIGTSSLLIKDVYVSTSIQGTRTQAISDNAAAATFVTIAVPTSDTTVGGRIFYTITAIDAGTAIQTKTGTYSFGLNNIGGTVTGAGTDVLEHSQLSAGTLAPTFSVNISGTNAQFQLVLDTSLDAAAETLKIEYRVQIDSGTATVTPAT